MLPLTFITTLTTAAATVKMTLIAIAAMIAKMTLILTVAAIPMAITTAIMTVKNMCKQL